MNKNNYNDNNNNNSNNNNNNNNNNKLCNKTGQMKPVESFQHQTKEATSCPSPQCPVDQIQVWKPILVVTTDQMPDHT